MLNKILLALRNPKRLFASLKYHLFLKYKKIDWEERATELGHLAVLDSRHSKDEYNSVTEFQKSKLLPLLSQLILPTDRMVLDFGCGVGRFTSELARIVNGSAIGVDISHNLLALCPTNQNVEYCHTSDLKKLKKGKFDVIFCCLVLGGISNKELKETASYLEDMLSDQGLLFIVESTGVKYRGGNWRIRTISFYQKLFSQFNLVYLDKYMDAGQQISIMSGRKFIN